MPNSLGLSIGMTNLVAARVGDPPVTRRAVLTLFPNRAPEVGGPSEHPHVTEPGVIMSGFVERVGDPVPLVASDGSTHRAEALLVEALDAMAHTVGNGPAMSVSREEQKAAPQVAIAVPAHWGPAVLGALRAALRTKPNLSPGGVPPQLVSDAESALAALRISPGLPDHGIVALLDFGGSGTSITLADAAADLAPIHETLRYTEFSGAQIDQALLTHVLADINRSTDADTAGTTAVGALTRLREQSRQAKERLSAETATVLSAELPGYRSDIRVTRAELENLINEPLAGVIAALEDMLQRNRIPGSSLSAVATVGGGAAIPLITQRLSERLRVPVITTPQPALNNAAGAALLAARGPGTDAATGLAAAASQAATGMATAAWAPGAGGAASQSAADGPASSTFRSLAWSQDQGGEEPVPYAGADYTYDPDATSARPQMEFLPPDEARVAEEPLPWYRRPQLIFGAALVAVLLTSAGLVWTLTSGTGSTPSKRSSTVTVPAATDPATPGAQLTAPVTTTGADGSPTVLVPPSSSTPEPAPSSSATTTPSTTTATTTTTTTQPPTTTTTQPPTTTTQPPTTTTQPPTSSAQPPTSSVKPPTSSVAPPPTSSVAPPPSSPAALQPGSSVASVAPVTPSVR